MRDTRVFYIGSNDSVELQGIRRHILRHFQQLPIAGEYLHRDMFDIAATYGKDTFLAIRYLGTPWLPRPFRFKSSFDAPAAQLGISKRIFSDRLCKP